MSGRERGVRGRAGRGRGGRGQHYTGTTATQKKGLFVALRSHVFDFGDKEAADQMNTSWEKLVQHVGTNFGQDISNEIQNKVRLTIPEPTCSAAIERGIDSARTGKSTSSKRTEKNSTKSSGISR